MRQLMIAALLPLAACGSGARADEGVPPDNRSASRNYPITNFSGVELRGSDDVEVRVGSAFAVRAQGDVETLDKLKIELAGDMLRVGRIRGFTWGNGGHAKVFVTMPRIDKASLAGSGNLAVDRVQGDTLAANIAGSGTMNLGTIAVGKADVSIAGSGNLLASGTATRLSVSIAGSGDMKAPALTASAADVSIAGSGRRDRARQWRREGIDHGIGRRRSRPASTLPRLENGIGRRALRRMIARARACAAGQAGRHAGA